MELLTLTCIESTLLLSPVIEFFLFCTIFWSSIIIGPALDSLDSANHGEENALSIHDELLKMHVRSRTYDI